MSRPEYRQLFHDMAIKRWESGNMEWLRKKMSDTMKQRIADHGIKGMIRSKAEDELISQLQELNIDCVASYRIESKIADIYIPKYNLLIEYNGNYWHCNPQKYDSDYFNTKKQKYAKEIWQYDQEKLDLFKKKGYLVEVIWESDYKKDNNILFNIIKKYDRGNN